LPTSRPSPDDLKRLAGPVDNSGLRGEEESASLVSSAQWQHLQGVVDHYRFRKQWSIFLILCIGVSLAFQIIVTVLVGLNILNYTSYKWFLPIVTGENFIQIVALAAIVLRWLFSGATPNKMLEGRD
jgi:hypothetical protein